MIPLRRANNGHVSQTYIYIYKIQDLKGFFLPR
jgi:hypothetical protein